jgi:hypothetical protein
VPRPAARERPSPDSRGNSASAADQVALGMAEQPQHLLSDGMGGAVIHIAGRHW